MQRRREFLQAGAAVAGGGPSGDILARGPGRVGPAGTRAVRPARSPRPERAQPSGRVQRTVDCPRERPRPRHGPRLAPVPRRPGHLPHGGRRLDPGFELRGAGLDRRRRRAIRFDRADDQGRLPDPRRHEHQLLRRRHAVGHLALLRGGETGRCGSATHGPAEARAARPAMGVFKHEAAAVDPRGQAGVPDRGPGGRRLLPLHPRVAEPRQGLLEVASVGPTAGSLAPGARPLGRQHAHAQQVPGTTRVRCAARESGSTRHGLRGHHGRQQGARLRHPLPPDRRHLRRPRRPPTRRSPGWTTSRSPAPATSTSARTTGPVDLDIGLIIPRRRRLARFLTASGPHHTASELTGVTSAPRDKRLYFSSQRYNGAGAIFESAARSATASAGLRDPPRVDSPRWTSSAYSCSAFPWSGDPVRTRALVSGIRGGAGGLEPTRSPELEAELELDDVDQMLEAQNARRRASGGRSSPRTTCAPGWPRTSAGATTCAAGLRPLTRRRPAWLGS